MTSRCPLEVVYLNCRVSTFHRSKMELQPKSSDSHPRINPSQHQGGINPNPRRCYALRVVCAFRGWWPPLGHLFYHRPAYTTPSLPTCIRLDYKVQIKSYERELMLFNSTSVTHISGSSCMAEYDSSCVAKYMHSIPLYLYCSYKSAHAASRHASCPITPSILTPNYALCRASSFV